MGDLIGEIVSGTLYRVTRAEMARLLGKGLQTNNKIELFASINRINALYMIARAGSGHIGSSFSSMEIMSYLYAKSMQIVAWNGKMCRPMRKPVFRQVTTLPPLQRIDCFGCVGRETPW